MKRLLTAACLVALTSIAHADPQDEVKVVSVQAQQLAPLGSFQHYSIRTEVENTGERGDVFVHISGLDASGFKIASTILKGRFEAGQTKAITGTTTVNPKNGLVATWEAISTNKFAIK